MTVNCYLPIECDPKTVQAEFMLSKRQYDDITGRTQEINVIAYQIRQSFKPGEIDPELANKISYELSMSFAKGNHAFIVATHIDKAHIHNHIIFNSTSLDCTKKFRDFKRSGKVLAQISDRLCLENGLSIIENPKRSKGHYGKWLDDNKPLSHSDKLRQTIDEALAQKPKTFDEFLQLVQSAGYEIKSGKHYAFKGAEQKNLSAFVLTARDIPKMKSRRSLAVKHHKEKSKNRLPNNRNSKKNLSICLWIYRQNYSKQGQRLRAVGKDFQSQADGTDSQFLAGT